MQSTVTLYQIWLTRDSSKDKHKYVMAKLEVKLSLCLALKDSMNNSFYLRYADCTGYYETLCM